MKQLPPGFTIDEAPQGNMGSLPEGFTLDTPQQPEQLSTGEGIVRPFARTARAAAVGTLGGAGDLAQMLTRPDPIGNLIYKGLDKLTGGNVYQKLNAPEPKPSEALGQTIDKATLGLTAPRDNTEKGIDTASGFLAGGGAELPFIVARGGKALAQAVPTLIGKLGNKSLNPDVLNAANAENIRINPSAITDNRVVQFLESRAAQSGLSGKSYDVMTHNLNDDFLKSYTDTLDGISKDRFTNSTNAGTTVQEALKARQEASQRLVRQKYGNVIDQHGENAIETPNTLNFIDDALSALQKTKSASPSKQIVINKLTDLRNNLLPKAPEQLPAPEPTLQDRILGITPKAPQPSPPKPTTVEELINTKSDLNDVIDYDVQGGVKQFLKGAVRGINNDLRQYGQQNPRFLKSFNTAESAAGVNAKTFRNNIVRSMMNNERPEMVLSSLNKPSDITKLDIALGDNPKMQAVGQAIKRMRLEDLLGNKIIKGSGDEAQVQFGNFGSQLSEQNKNNSLIRSLAGPEQYQRLTNLRTVADGVSRGNRFFNFSKSGNVAIDVGLIVSSITGLSHGNVLSAATTGTPYVVSKIITSKPLMNALTGAVRAQNSANPALGAAAATSFIDMLSKEGVFQPSQNPQEAP